MFTGIVEEVGIVGQIDLESPLESIFVEGQRVLQGTQVGDSMAVNGTCLTVTRAAEHGFAVGVMPETLRRSNLGSLSPGDQVNLERALQPSGRLGGHFVQGHIDGVGTVVSVVPDDEALTLRIGTDSALLRYIVTKGFIAVDGISLTVTEVDETGFAIALIPFTQQNIASGLIQTGHSANLEVDILAKYVEKLVVH